MDIRIKVIDPNPRAKLEEGLLDMIIYQLLQEKEINKEDEKKLAI